MRCGRVELSSSQVQRTVLETVQGHDTERGGREPCLVLVGAAECMQWDHVSRGLLVQYSGHHQSRHAALHE